MRSKEGVIYEHRDTVSHFYRGNASSGTESILRGKKERST